MPSTTALQRFALCLGAGYTSILIHAAANLAHFYRASIRKVWVHTLSTRGSEKNDAKLTAVCIRDSYLR